MALAKTYDKVSWHFPEGKGCQSLEAAIIHFTVVMQWLQKKGLLSTEGHEAMQNGIDSEFSLTAYMLTADGVGILDKCYSNWVSSIQYGKVPSTDLLDRCYRISKERDR